jgi:aminocarboxymuconate-semialdehyde decarboxylase
VIVDVHTHYAARSLLDGDVVVSGTGERLPAHYPELWDPEAKLADLDARGIGAAVVSLTPHLFTSDPKAARRANDELADYCDHPRLHALATLGEDAGELERCVETLGFVGAQIPTSPLSEDVLAAAAALGVPLVLHPFYGGPFADPDLFLHNSLGVPFDTALAAARLICSGTLDRHPRLKLVLVHGGGSLPYQLGRLDNAHAHGRDACARAPSSYLGQFWCDSVVHSPRALQFLAGVIGVGHVLLGTDRPYVTGEQRPVEQARAAGLDPDALGANAAALFGVRPPVPRPAAPAPAGPSG